jgi:hypothetical protein
MIIVGSAFFCYQLDRIGLYPQWVRPARFFYLYYLKIIWTKTIYIYYIYMIIYIYLFMYIIVYITYIYMNVVSGCFWWFPPFPTEPGSSRPGGGGLPRLRTASAGTVPERRRHRAGAAVDPSRGGLAASTYRGAGDGHDGHDGGMVIESYPLVNKQVAIENGHRNSGFYHQK